MQAVTKLMDLGYEIKTNNGRVICNFVGDNLPSEDISNLFNELRKNKREAINFIR